MKKFNFKPNFKSKKTWIILSIIVILIVIGFSLFGGKKGLKYETAKVERGNLVQTVDATGKIESSNDLSLHFDGMGIVETVRVKEGDTVRAGQWLANLSLSQLNAGVAQAQASLDQKLVGATPEQIAVSQKQVESAQISLNKAEDTLKDTVSLSGKNLSAKYDYALTVLDDSYIKMYNAFIATKNIQTAYFTGYDQESLNVKSNLSYNIEKPKDQAKLTIDLARSSKKIEDIDAAIIQTKDSLGKILLGLTAVRNSCDQVPYQNTVTSTEKTSLDTQKSYISGLQATISSLQNDISILRTQNENSANAAKATVDAAKANLELQQANYDSLVAKPRDIDIAYYQAILDQAIASRNKAIIYAPIDGVVTKVNKKKGELINSSEAMIELLSPHYEIQVDVPETDVVKLSVNNEATITLDALGSDIKFDGKVLSIDPASTEIQDVVYYRIKVAINDSGDGTIKPGMTADVLIKTESRDGVLFIPSRAILTKADTGEKYVRVLKNGVIEEKTIKLGLKADDGKVEVVSGLDEGEDLVLREIK
ncbi:MAG: HlyD family efflux transporter periplasmic adaptor subunit [Candidatus Paceibacterota bacterium]|jgi:RND family efflux transporter MFP subunit